MGAVDNDNDQDHNKDNDDNNKEITNFMQQHTRNILEILYVNTTNNQ